MKIVVISGSARQGSQSLKVATWLMNQLEAMSIETELVDLSLMDLPVTHEESLPETDSQEAESLRSTFDSADGFVMVTPEWNGMASPALKNMFVYVRKSMAYKPAYLVAVSAVRGGAYPIAELRMNSAKNTYINYLPEHLIVRGVNGVMNDDSDNATDDSDKYVRARAIYGLRLLIEYSKSLSSVRDSGVIDLKTYENGM